MGSPATPPARRRRPWWPWAVGVVIAYAVGVNAGASDETTTTTASDPKGPSAAAARPPTSTPTPTATSTPSSAATKAQSQQATAAAEWLPVVDVVDGDTIKVRRGAETVTLRLIGMDSPETESSYRPAGCYGLQASKRARDLLAGASVRLEFDPSQGRLDSYGRTLAYVWMRDGRLFNEVMIKEGYAEEYTYDAAYKYQSRFRAAERAARQADAGLWGECGGGEPEVSTPESTSGRDAGGLDPRFGTCREATVHGYGPYHRGNDPEYDWYVDRDKDGVVCE
jgi:micrococcal nuclease